MVWLMVVKSYWVDGQVGFVVGQCFVRASLEQGLHCVWIVEVCEVVEIKTWEASRFAMRKPKEKPPEGTTIVAIGVVVTICTIGTSIDIESCVPITLDCASYRFPKIEV